MVQNGSLAIHIKSAFGLAFDVERTSDRKSGFKPALFDLGAGKFLFGNLRLDGFAASLKTGFAEMLVLAGGDEGRYKDEKPPVNRANAIREMLVHDCGIDPERVRALPSRSNTGGNIAVIRSFIESENLRPEDCGLVSNHYHLPRAHLDLTASGLPLRMFSAEALWLLEDAERKNELIKRLGEGHLAERYAEEIAGIADKMRGTYEPRTDTPVVFNPVAADR